MNDNVWMALPRPHETDAPKDLDTSLVPEIPDRIYSEFDALTVNQNITHLEYFLSQDLSLSSLKKHEGVMRKLQKEWTTRWQAEYAIWKKIGELAKQRQNELAKEYSQRGALAPTMAGIPDAFSLFLFGNESLPQNDEALLALIPTTSEDDKVALGSFLVTLTEVIKIIRSEFQLAYAPSLLYTQEFARFGLSTEQASLLQEWMLSPHVHQTLLPDGDAESPFRGQAFASAFTRDVVSLGQVPQGLGLEGSRLLESAKVFVTLKLFKLPDTVIEKKMDQAFEGEYKFAFGQLNFGNTAEVGYKLHIKGSFSYDAYLYPMISAVGEYLTRKKISGKIRLPQSQYGFGTRWDSTLITIWGGNPDMSQEDLQAYFDAQLEEILTIASELETIQAAFPNKSVETAKSDFELRIGRNESHRLSLRFGVNTDDEAKGKEWEERLHWKDERDRTFMQNFPNGINFPLTNNG